LIAAIVNLCEESGQLAFLTPHLQRRNGPLLASLIVAVIWAFMHLPALFVPSLGVGVAGPLSIEGVALSMGVLVVYAIPVRFLATWLFNNARQSVVIVALFHAAMNSAQAQFQQLIPGYNSFYLIAAFAVVSFVLIAVTRGKLGYKQEEAPISYQGEAAQPAAASL
jgi:membrane protease YdiL (CAAX protease family)